MSQNFVEIHPLWMDLYSCPFCRVNRKFSSHGCGRVSNLMANVTVQFCCKRNVVLYWTWAFQSSWAFGKTSSNLWGQSSSQELYELSSTQHPTLWCECYGNEEKKKKKRPNIQKLYTTLDSLYRYGFYPGRVTECFSTTGARAPAAATLSQSTLSTASLFSPTTSGAAWPGSHRWG